MGWFMIIVGCLLVGVFMLLSVSTRRAFGDAVDPSYRQTELDKKFAGPVFLGSLLTFAMLAILFVVGTIALCLQHLR